MRRDNQFDMFQIVLGILIVSLIITVLICVLGDNPTAPEWKTIKEIIETIGKIL